MVSFSAPASFGYPLPEWASPRPAPPRLAVRTSPPRGLQEHRAGSCGSVRNHSCTHIHKHIFVPYAHHYSSACPHALTGGGETRGRAREREMRWTRTENGSLVLHTLDFVSLFWLKHRVKAEANTLKYRSRWKELFSCYSDITISLDLSKWRSSSWCKFDIDRDKNIWFDIYSALEIILKVDLDWFFCSPATGWVMNSSCSIFIQLPSGWQVTFL